MVTLGIVLAITTVIIKSQIYYTEEVPATNVAPSGLPSLRNDFVKPPAVGK